MPTFTPVNISPIAKYTLTTQRIGKKQIWRPNQETCIESLPLGKQNWWGIPFKAGYGQKIGMLPQPGPHTLELKLGQKAEWLIVAHCSDLCHAQGSPLHGVVEPGEHLADYILHYNDGSQSCLAIRRRFEISDYWFEWGQLPFNCWCHREYKARHEKTEIWGQDQVHLSEGTYGLWAYWWLLPWQNPYPDKIIERVIFNSTGKASIAIGAITLGHDPAHPIKRPPRQTLRVTVKGGEEIDAKIDRGVILRNTETTPPAKDFEKSKLRGWGRDPSTPKTKNKRIIEAFAHPDAKLKIEAKSGGKSIRGAVRWGDVIEKRVVTGNGRIQVGPASSQVNRVHIRVVDQETGNPTPVRIHLCTPDGDYIPPAGHNRFVNEAWFEDVGSDLVLGGMTYAYIDGTCQADLPVGEVLVEAAKGFEYTPVRKRLKIRPGTKEIDLPISRWTNLRSEGWMTGDTHVHFVSPETGRLESQAEDVNVFNLLAAKWGELYTNVGDITGAVSGVSNDDVIVYVSTENRQHVMGHISLLGCKSPVYPLSTGEADEAGIGEPMEVMIGEWTERCREAGGLVIQPHFPNPYAESPVNLILNKIDGAEVRYFSGTKDISYGHREYYRILNCGVRLAIVGGTDKMSNSMPIGGVRTYAYTGKNSEFSYDSWANAIREGRTFTSSGPILDLRVEGKRVGGTLRLPARGGSVEVEAWAKSSMPFDTLEIVCGGKVVAAADTGRNKQSAKLQAKVPIEQSTWLAARCYGKNRVWHCWPIGVEAHTSPIYVYCGRQEIRSPEDATYLLTVVHGAETYINNLAAIADRKTKQRFLRRIHQAREELIARGGHPPE